MDAKFKLLVLSYGLSTFAEGIIMPVYAFFVQNIGGGILETTGVISIFLLVSGLTSLWVHKNKWTQVNVKKMLIFGWMLWLIGIFFYLIISNLFTLIIAQIFMALGNAVANPAFDSELASNTKPTKNTSQWSIFEASQDIFNGIAAFLSGIIIIYLGFKVLIIFMCITATFSFLLILNYKSSIK